MVGSGRDRVKSKTTLYTVSTSDRAKSVASSPGGDTSRPLQGERLEQETLLYTFDTRQVFEVKT